MLALTLQRLLSIVPIPNKIDHLGKRLDHEWTLTIAPRRKFCSERQTWRSRVSAQLHIPAQEGELLRSERPSKDKHQKNLFIQIGIDYENRFGRRGEKIAQCLEEIIYGTRPKKSDLATLELLVQGQQLLDARYPLASQYSLPS
ncbi:hypothetical protein ACFS07_03595 [Undibacterium arcticum]